MKGKKVKLTKTDIPENKKTSAYSEEQTEFIDGCYYAPWDF